MKILVAGAHPDDPEALTGSALKWIRDGHSVRFLSVTDGSAGHHIHSREALRKMRRREADAVCEYLKLDGYLILPIPDGCLTTDLPSRELLMREIRKFAPDLIITHRPSDYHPDHRAAGTLVADCSYLVRVPLVLPDCPIPERCPAIFYMTDCFTKPEPFRADYINDVSCYIDNKTQSYFYHTSQFFEWLPWIDGYDMTKVPPENDRAARFEWLYNRRLPRWNSFMSVMEASLDAKIADKNRREKIKFAEGFEKSEYGGGLLADECRMLFDFC